MTSTMLTLLICAIFTLGVVAAPPVFAPADALTADGAPIRRIPTPVKVSKTQPRDARCTDGVPASEQHHSDYPIRGYTKIEPQASMVSYEVRKDWYDAHWVSGPHVSSSFSVLSSHLCCCWLGWWLTHRKYMASTHSSDPYSAFECQFTCNANDSCTAYFVWYGEFAQ